jgi:hypothetical protein
LSEKLEINKRLRWQMQQRAHCRRELSTNHMPSAVKRTVWVNDWLTLPLYHALSIGMLS